MNFWSEKRVLVTGATGFVGYWLTQRLVEEKAFVVALVRDHDPQTEIFRSGLINQVSIVSGSLESYETLERALCEYEIDTVFHLAAQTLVGIARKAPLITFESNIRGTYHLLEACRRQRDCVKRIVIASSDKAYGSSSSLPYTENMPLKGHFPYDVSKSCCDLISQSYFHTYNLPLTIARCGNIFGERDLNWSRLIPGTIRCLLRHEAPIVRSDGTFVRNYIYVKDVVSAFLLLAEKVNEKGVKGEGFNFAPPEPFTVLEIIQTLQKLLECEHLVPQILNNAQTEIKDQFLCSKKAEERLGWLPQYPLEEGLKETFGWYRDYLGSRDYALC